MQKLFKIWVVFAPFWHLLSVVKVLLWVVGGIYIGSEHDTCLPITFNGRLHHQEPFLQKLFSIHSVPSPLSDRKAKLVHYISSLSREPLFRTRTLPYLLEFDSVAFLTYVQVQNQGLFCSSHPCKCQSLFNQSNLLNRKPLIRVRPGLPPPHPRMVLERWREARR